MPVCITGMHRSGTSAVANTLHRCGLFLGEQQSLLPATVDNREGHWENAAIVELNDQLLSVLGGAWDKPPPARAPDAPPDELEQLEQRAREALSALQRPEPWGWKDPRSSLTLPFWLQLIPDLRVVVCVRDPRAVARSLVARDGFDAEEAVDLWLAYASALLDTAPPDRSLYVSYESLLGDPAPELNRLATFTGLEPTPVQRALAETVLDLGLRHQLGGDPADDHSGEVGRTYERLLELTRTPGPSEPPPEPGLDEELAASRELLSEARRRTYALQDELAERTTERGELWLRLQDLESQERLLTEGKAAVRAELERTLEAERSVNEHLRLANKRLAYLQQRVEETGARLERVLEDRTALEEEHLRELRALEEQVDVLHRSRSFRLTAPLRRVASVLRAGGAHE